VSLYWKIATTAFRRFSTYRIATAASVLENSAISMLRGFVYLAVVHARGGVHGLTPAGAMTFAFVAGGIETAFWITVPLDIVERIKTGDVVTDLYRPVDFQAWWLATEAGRAAFNVLGRGLPPLVFGLLVFDLIAPESVGALVLFVVSIVLAFAIVFAWKFAVSLSGFWLFDTRGAFSLAGVIVTVTSGALLPLALLPTWFAHAIRWLPFASIIQTPFELWSGGHAAAPLLLVQVAWAALLLVVGRVILRRAVARVVVQGG
jgi:ABC-2 type transport system permease protein